MSSSVIQLILSYKSTTKRTLLTLLALTFLAAFSASVATGDPPAGDPPTALEDAVAAAIAQALRRAVLPAPYGARHVAFDARAHSPNGELKEGMEPSEG